VGSGRYIVDIAIVLLFVKLQYYCNILDIGRLRPEFSTKEREAETNMKIPLKYL
jgi:hypothetical protein